MKTRKCSKCLGTMYMIDNRAGLLTFECSRCNYRMSTSHLPDELSKTKKRI